MFSQSLYFACLLFVFILEDTTIFEEGQDKKCDFRI